MTSEYWIDLNLNSLCGNFLESGNHYKNKMFMFQYRKSRRRPNFPNGGVRIPAMPTALLRNCLSIGSHVFTPCFRHKWWVTIAELAILRALSSFWDILAMGALLKTDAPSSYWPNQSISQSISLRRKLVMVNRQKIK